jgi:hypothetical protein
MGRGRRDESDPANYGWCDGDVMPTPEPDEPDDGCATRWECRLRSAREARHAAERLAAVEEWLSRLPVMAATCGPSVPGWEHRPACPVCRPIDETSSPDYGHV